MCKGPTLPPPSQRLTQIQTSNVTQEGIPFEGNYSGWLERKAQRIQQEGACLSCLLSTFFFVSTHICVRAPKPNHKPHIHMTHARHSPRRRQALQGAGAGVGVDPHVPQGSPDEEQGPDFFLRGDGPGGRGGARCAFSSLCLTLGIERGCE